MDIRAKLQELGHELPQASSAAANYVPYIAHDGLLYISGQIPFLNGEKMHIGRVGKDIGMEQAVEAAEACALNILAQADDAVKGDWSKIERCLKLGGFVNCTPDFNDHPAVINGASNLIGEVLEKAGRHTRFAVGTPSLPFGVAVEIEALFALRI